MSQAGTFRSWRDSVAPFLQGGRRFLALGFGLAGLLLLAGWGLDALYERRVEKLREAIWRLEAEVAAGAVTDQSFRDMAANVGFQRARTAAQLSPWDYGRPSWKFLSRAADGYVKVPSLLTAGTARETRRQITDARSLVTQANRYLAAWWWEDMTPPPWETS